MNFRVSILILVFYSPNTTVQVFAQIKKALPNFLFIATAHPRLERDGETKKVSANKRTRNKLHLLVLQPLNFL